MSSDIQLTWPKSTVKCIFMQASCKSSVTKARDQLKLEGALPVLELLWLEQLWFCDAYDIAFEEYKKFGTDGANTN